MWLRRCPARLPNRSYLRTPWHLVSIVVAHGLVTFFFAMAAALVLYLRPHDRPFAWPVRLGAWAKRRVADVRKLSFRPRRLPEEVRAD